MAFFSLASRITATGLLFLALLNCNNGFAANNEQTLIMTGSAIETCTTLSPQFCKLDAPLGGEKSAVFALSSDAIARVKQQWPTDNQNHLAATVTNLKTLATTHPELLSKRELLWAWRDIANLQMSELSQLEFEYVIDMLQVAQPDGQNRVLNIDAKNSKADQNWLADSYKFIAASLKVKAQSPKLLVISAASRDPYFAASYYETVLSQVGVTVQWLALTPALAQAITAGQCDALDEYRTQSMSLYNRETVFPKRVATEQALCEQGIEQLITKIKGSTGVVLAGDHDQQNLYRSFFDEQSKPYPWLSAVRDTPVLIAENQSAEFLAMEHIINQQQNAADVLNSDDIAYRAGLNSVDFAFIKSQFSETNSTALITKALQSTNQQAGLGIDANTALVIIKSKQGDLMTVLGERGVIGLTANTEQNFSYSYWPSSSVFHYSNKVFSLNKRSAENALPNIKIPSLPTQRFSNILTNNKLRSLTQAMCLSQDTAAVGQQDGFLVNLNAIEATTYKRINATQFGCAIEQLAITFFAIE